MNINSDKTKRRHRPTMTRMATTRTTTDNIKKRMTVTGMALWKTVDSGDINDDESGSDNRTALSGGGGGAMTTTMAITIRARKKRTRMAILMTKIVKKPQRKRQQQQFEKKEDNNQTGHCNAMAFRWQQKRESHEMQQLPLHLACRMLPPLKLMVCMWFWRQIA